MEAWYNGLFLFSLVILAVIIIIYVIRSILGPTLADRILAVNAIGTCTILAIAFLAVGLRKSYLLDVCMIYALLSFLAVVVLAALINREQIEIHQPEVEEELREYKAHGEGADRSALAKVKEARRKNKKRRQARYSGTKEE